ncbi:MAG: hypothetical protein NVSMB33_13000 [Ktedonobacteraceae bacterium]
MHKEHVTAHRVTQRLFKKRSQIGIAFLTLCLMIAGVIVALPRANAADAAGTPTLTISPTSGAYTNRDDQAPIHVRGAHFGANETVKIYWNYRGPSNPGTLVQPTFPSVTNGQGTFTTSFLYILAATGTYTIAGVGQTSHAVATGKFTLYPYLYIRPQAGGPGSTTTFYGDAFGAGEKVNVYWNYKGSNNKGQLLGTDTADANGAFPLTTSIPTTATPGAYLIAAIGQSSKLISKYTYNVYTPTLELAPFSGAAATPLQVSAFGFTGNETVDVFWNGGTTPLTSVATSEYGYLQPTTITVPAGTAAGKYQVKIVGRSSHIAAINTFTIVAASSRLDVTSGPVGNTVNVTGQGYAPEETVNIQWNGTTIASSQAGYAGVVQGTFVVPPAANGSYSVGVVGVASKSVTQNTYIINNSLAVSPTSAAPGSRITVTGSGFQASEQVKIMLNRASGALLGTAVANAQGNISTGVTLPANTLTGMHSVFAEGETSGSSFSTQVNVDTNWGDFGFDNAHHRQNLNENSVNASNVANLQLKWTATTAVGLKNSPVYANGVVYIATMDGLLNAYDAVTGTRKWQFNCQCIFRSFSAPLVDANSGLVFFGTVGYADEGIPSPFYALDAQTGALEWSQILPWHQLGFPTLAFNTLYVGISHLDHGACALYALDELSGHINWQYVTQSGVWGAVGVDTNTKVVFTGIGNPDSAVTALHAMTGQTIWNTPIPPVGPDDDVGSGVTVDHGMVYASSKNGKVYALNETTGKIAWSTSIGAPANGDISTQAISSTGVVYVGSINGDLYALNAKTGAILWQESTGGPIFSSPAIANGVVYFASLDHKFYAVNAATGVVRWKYTTGSFSYSSPIFVNGWLYCGSADGKLYAFHL